MLELTPLPADYTEQEYNLAWPRSHCSHCGTQLKFYDLIPLFSYLQLRGKCRYCKQRISWTYPAVELLTAIIFVIIYMHFGLSLLALAAAFYLCSLLILTILDYQYHVLPDSITLPILWLGLLVNTFDFFVPLEDAVIGAIVGYLSLWLIYWIHNWLTGKTGLGYGDFKLLALLGAWLGWQELPLIVVCASAIGLIYAAVEFWRGHLSRTTPLPFGSFLAIVGGVLLLC
jgi:leader peptidase (prepilin peptidase)/N-methyltransferase